MNYYPDIISGYSDYLSIFLSTYLVTGIIGIIVACIFGAITKNINESKGYNGGFAWGFWLGVIGIIVVACRQPNPYYTNPRESIIRKQPPAPINEVATQGGWKCTCGRGHANYETSCICGRSKAEVLALVKKENNASNNVDTIKEYKKLLDDGIITEEEFDAKKKQLLGL